MRTLVWIGSLSIQFRIIFSSSHAKVIFGLKTRFSLYFSRKVRELHASGVKFTHKNFRES